MSSTPSQGGTPPPAPPPPELPTPPWAGGRARRRRVLTREAIVEATLAIVDAEGCDAVSMRKVAGHLGVAASSLYQHFATRDELLQAAVHQVLDDSSGVMPDTGVWDADLRAFFVGLHARLAAHADLVRWAFADTTAPNGSDDLRDVELLLQRLTAAGLGPREAVQSFDRLMLYTIADVYESWRFQQKQNHEATREWIESMRRYMAEVPRDEFPLIAEHHDLLMNDGAQHDGFEYGLDLMLAGMRAQAGVASPRP